MKTLEVALAGVVRPDILGGGGRGLVALMVALLFVLSLVLDFASWVDDRRVLLSVNIAPLRGVAGSEVERRPTSLSSVRLCV